MICKGCDEEFEPKRKGQSYCSNACRERAYYLKRKVIKGPTTYHRVCVQCDREFDTISPVKKLCSPECSSIRHKRQCRNNSTAKREAERKRCTANNRHRVALIKAEIEEQRRAKIAARRMTRVKESFCCRDIQSLPVNRLPGVVNGIIDGRNTLTGVRR